MPVHLSPLPDDANAIRVVKNSDREFDIERGKKPPSSVFNLSTKDKEQTPPRLSVFDAKLTRLAEAKTIANKTEDSCGFLLNVKKIREIGNGRLDVVYDKLMNNTLPGAEGHAGILGLKRNNNKEKELIRKIKWQLAEISQLYDDK